MRKLLASLALGLAALGFAGASVAQDAGVGASAAAAARRRRGRRPAAAPTAAARGRGARCRGVRRPSPTRATSPG